MNTVSPGWGKERAERFSKAVPPSVYTRMARRITSDLSDGDGHFTFLDLGCGPGQLLVEVKKLFPHARVIGVDPSEDMLRLARGNLKPFGSEGAEIRSGKAESIPMDSESVDLLMAQFSLHEWEDLNQGFSEIKRVLKPGGIMVMRAWNKSCPFLKFLKHNVEHIFKMGWHRAREARISRRRSYPFRTIMEHIREIHLEPIELEEDVVAFIKAKKGRSFS